MAFRSRAAVALQGISFEAAAWQTHRHFLQIDREWAADQALAGGPELEINPGSVTGLALEINRALAKDRELRIGQVLATDPA